MSAYLIAQVRIHDPEAYGDYAERTPAIIAKHGGRILARGGQTEILEGHTVGQRIVIVEFPSLHCARAFYYSPEYQEIRRIRTQASVAELVLVQGI